MKKIPTIFDRDWAGNRQVIDTINPDAQWVFDGEGWPTQKIDGTSCLIRDKKLYKRYQIKKGRTPPPDFEASEDPDPITGEQTGWVPVGDGPEDKYHREAYAERELTFQDLSDGTYELIGPKVQGNPYKLSMHALEKHDDDMLCLTSVPKDLSFESLKAYLTEHHIEGIVWHSGDGRMAKLKRRDFGIQWP